MYLVTSARLLLLYFALTLQNSIAVGQTPKAIQLADSLLRPGKYKAAITTYDFPNNIKQLQDKAIKNLKNNPKWADKYIVRLVEKGSAGIPKDLDAYGLTNEEFNSMLNAFKNRQMAIFSDTTSFEIKKKEGVWTFKTSGKLALFNDIRIDSKNQVISFYEFKVVNEIAIEGKFYAPILYGIEAFSTAKYIYPKNDKGISGFGLTIGKNKGDTRTTMTLLYNVGQPTEIKFITITIL